MGTFFYCKIRLLNYQQNLYNMHTQQKTRDQKINDYINYSFFQQLTSIGQYWSHLFKALHTVVCTNKNIG